MLLMLEPWGEDYWLNPEDTFEITPEKPDDGFLFEMEHRGENIAVYAEGCEYFRVVHDGKSIECGYQRPESAFQS